jgi:hypothetical protein
MNTFVAATTPPQVVGMESHSSSSTSDNNDDKRKEEEEGEETPVAAGSHVTTPPGIQPSLAVKCKRDRLWRRNFISSSNKNKNKNKKANKDPSNWEQQVGDEDLLGDVDGCCCLPKRIFWKGSLDSQGCPPASTEEIKEIFYHSFMVGLLNSILLCLVLSFGNKFHGSSLMSITVLFLINKKVMMMMKV